MQKALKWLCSENNAIALAASFKKQMIALLLSPPAGQGTRDYFFPIPVFSVATRGGGSYFILSLCVKSRVDGMPGNRRSVLGLQTPSSRARFLLNVPVVSWEGGTHCCVPLSRQWAPPAPTWRCSSRPQKGAVPGQPSLPSPEASFLKTSKRAGKSSWPGDKSILSPHVGLHLVLFLGVPPAHSCSCYGSIFQPASVVPELMGTVPQHHNTAHGEPQNHPTEHPKTTWPPPSSAVPGAHRAQALLAAPLPAVSALRGLVLGHGGSPRLVGKRNQVPASR